MADGVITEWGLDRNQDGVSEIDVEFEGRLPSVAIIESPSGLATVRYERYPYVYSVALPHPDGSVRSIVRPRSLRYTILDGLPEAGPLYGSEVQLRQPLPRLDLRSVARGAIAEEDVSPDGLVTERRYLDQGVVTRLVADLDRDGAWDLLTVMEDGMPKASVRDIDNDGRFEVVEGFDHGRLVIRAIDENDNGTPEIVELFEDDAREWDLNEDGEIDLREFGLMTDSVLDEFEFLELNR